jgi:hypothetical protein
MAKREWWLDGPIEFPDLDEEPVENDPDFWEYLEKLDEKIEEQIRSL